MKNICLSLAAIDASYTIDISVNKGARNGVLYNGRGQRAGAVVFLTSKQRSALKALHWTVQGNGPEYSIWSPSRCGALSTGGWTPSVTKSRTCMSAPVLDSRFGILRDAQGNAELLFDKSQLAGAVVNTYASQRAYLAALHWTIQGNNSQGIRSIWSPSWCRPLALSNFKVVITPPSPGSSGVSALCYTISELNALYGVVTSVNDGPRAKDGRLLDEKTGQTIGAVIRTTQQQRDYLSSHGWILQGADSSGIRSAFAPTSCRPLKES